MFFTHFVVSFIVSSFTVTVIVGMKKMFQKQLSAKWNYNLWLLFMIALILPFLPIQLIHFGDAFSFDISPSYVPNNSVELSGDSKINNENWMQNFTISVNRFDSTFLNETLTSIWILGMLVMITLTLYSLRKLQRIKSTSTNLENKEIVALFVQCKKSLLISRDLIIQESPLIKSPLTFGLFKTYVVLPQHMEEWLSMEDIKNILLHELNHYKNKDVLTNYLMIFYQILYWYNPFVWFAFREMRVDREIACDSAVLHSLNEHSYTQYGNTLLKFVDKSTHSRYLPMANQLNESKKQIKRRIENIANFTIETKLLKWKSISIFLFLGLFVAVQVPITSVLAYDQNRYEFKREGTKHEDLSKYFNGYEGSFVLYDLQADQYSIYNENKSTLRVSPNSTYKIYSALFALESNIITSKSSIIKWDGKHYPYDSWNTDQNLATGIKNSVNWLFHDLDRKVGSDTIEAYLKQIGYGNRDLSGGISQFWMESSLKISPVEQVSLLQTLYTNKFGFKDKNIQTVKDIIKLEEKEGMVLSGKTGTGSVNGNNSSGWFIGYVETKQNTYFFATNIQNENNAFGSKAATITKSILKDKGIY